MNSVVRISFFIVLSAALHLWGLSFDAMLLAKPLQSHQVGIDYVSRSLASFYPVPTPKTSHKEVVKNPPPSLKKKITPAVEPSQSNQITIKHPEKMKSVVAKQLLKTNNVPLKVITEPEENSPSPVDIDAVEIRAEASAAEDSDPALEVVTYLPDPTPADSEPQNESDTSLFAGVATQTETAIIDQASVSPSQGQGAVAATQETSNALPRYDLNPSPHYPKVAKLRGWEGKVVFEALILKSGRVGHLNVLASSGYRSLDNAARKAINRWQFKPATSFGISIDSQVKIPITFSLKNL